MTGRLADLTDVDGEDIARGAGGLLASLVVGVVVQPYRRSIGLENVVIVYLLVVVATAAIGGRAAGVISALSAALPYDFFLDHPFHTLAIDSASQVITVLLLCVAGLVASMGAQARRRARQRAATKVHGQAGTIRLLRTVILAMAGGQDADRVAAEGIRELLGAERVLVTRQGPDGEQVTADAGATGPPPAAGLPSWTPKAHPQRPSARRGWHAGAPKPRSRPRHRAAHDSPRSTHRDTKGGPASAAGDQARHRHHRARTGRRHAARSAPIRQQGTAGRRLDRRARG